MKCSALVYLHDEFNWTSEWIYLFLDIFIYYVRISHNRCLVYEKCKFWYESVKIHIMIPNVRRRNVFCGGRGVTGFSWRSFQRLSGFKEGLKSKKPIRIWLWKKLWTTNQITLVDATFIHFQAEACKVMMTSWKPVSELTTKASGKM